MHPKQRDCFPFSGDATNRETKRPIKKENNRTNYKEYGRGEHQRTKVGQIVNTIIEISDESICGAQNDVVKRRQAI
ncbi:hypothetical protein J6590_055371 [Homalodisca vitripennis]|nr:hypothetical protein J6590_055371 [Homalodisca vitripennis]